MKRLTLTFLFAFALSACTSTSELKAPCKVASLDGATPCLSKPINLASEGGVSDAS